MIEVNFFNSFLKKNTHWQADELIILLDAAISSNWKPQLEIVKEKLEDISEYKRGFIKLKEKTDYEIENALKFIKDNKNLIKRDFEFSIVKKSASSLLQLTRVPQELRDFLSSSFLAKEGQSKISFHFFRERNKAIVNLKKDFFIQQHGGLYCEACGFDFFSKYGERGKNYAEVHHNIPISDPGFTGKTRLSDLSVLCSNCHRMIHRKNPWISVAELKNIINQQKVA